jgi:hypothetical protein
MKNEFVPYELALRMKQLGFDENGFAYYYLYKDKPLLETQGSYDFGTHSNSVTAPLYQQAFRWFREKYPEINPTYNLLFILDKHLRQKIQ